MLACRFALRDPGMWRIMICSVSHRTQRTSTFSRHLFNCDLWTHQMRHCDSFGTFLNASNSDKNTNWKQAFSNAEKIVGYPTSYLSLRVLLSDEISNIAQRMRKLIGTPHPLLKTAKRLVYDGKNGYQMRGLTILLVSKAAGLGKNMDERMKEDMIDGIHKSQRSIAEICEMIWTASLVHNGVVNLQSLPPCASLKDMEFGNKMAILGGDFILARASVELSKLNNTTITECISEAIGDIAEAGFSVGSDQYGGSIPHAGMAMVDWLETTELGVCNLLAKSCKCAVLVTGHDAEFQAVAYEFGSHLARVYQLHNDIQALTNGKLEEFFSLTSAPVIFYLESNPGSILHKYLLAEQASDKLDYITLRNNIVDSGCVEKARELCASEGAKALHCLTEFPDSEAKQALEGVVAAVINV